MLIHATTRPSSWRIAGANQSTCRSCVSSTTPVTVRCARAKSFRRSAITVALTSVSFAAVSNHASGFASTPTRSEALSAAASKRPDPQNGSSTVAALGTCSRTSSSASSSATIAGYGWRRLRRVERPELPRSDLEPPEHTRPPSFRKCLAPARVRVVPHEQDDEQILSRGPGPSGSAGSGSPRRTPVAVGGGYIDRREDRLHGADTP